MLYSNLRSHQQRAADAITSGVDKGQVLLPTGVGKTMVQTYKILHTIQKKGGDLTVSVLASHRLLLCEQLIQELVKVAADKGLTFNVLTVASDGVDIQDVAMMTSQSNPLGNLGTRCLVEQCTSNTDIRAFAKKTKMLNRHLLVVSTYHSFDRMVGLNIDVACLDEAHTTTEEDKHAKVEAMLPYITEVFFFTATQVTGLNGRGMDNTFFYGQVLTDVAPRAAIDTHDILPPIFHNVSIITGKPTERNIIQAAYKSHRDEVLKVSKGKLNPKLLVSVAGVSDMVALLTDHEFHLWALDNGVNVIGFSSSRGYYHNGLEVTRKEAIQAIRDLQDDDSAIIMHYDILTEGIDLPTITAVMPLRELNKVKFLQTLGRAARLQIDDRRAIYSGSIAGTEVNSSGVVEADLRMVKPYYWVIISPLLNKHAIDTNQTLVEIVRTAYQIEPEARDQPAVSTSSTPEDAESVLPENTLLPKEKGVTQYNHVFEALVFKSMSPTQQESIIKTTLQEMKNATQNQIPVSQANPPMLTAAPVVPQASHPVPRSSGKSRHDSYLGIWGTSNC